MKRIALLAAAACATAWVPATVRAEPPPHPPSAAPTHEERSPPPNGTFGLTLGAALTDLRANGPNLALHLGARASVLFVRKRDSQMGVGPYVELMTHAFDTFEAGGGVEWLIPVLDDFPLVLSAGGFARSAKDVPSVEPGLASTLFFGSRSYNFHSWYGLAAGLFVQGRYGLGDAKQADLVIGAQIDMFAIAAPFILLYNAVAR